MIMRFGKFTANAATEILAMRRVTWKRMSRRAIVGDIYFWLECEMNVSNEGLISPAIYTVGDLIFL